MSTGAGDGGGGGVGAVQSSGGGRNTPPHGSPTPMDKATLKVHLPNGKLFHPETRRQRTVALDEKMKGSVDETRLLLARTNKNCLTIRVLSLSCVLEHTWFFVRKYCRRIKIVQ